MSSHHLRNPENRPKTKHEGATMTPPLTTNPDASQFNQSPTTCLKSSTQPHYLRPGDPLSSNTPKNKTLYSTPVFSSHNYSSSPSTPQYDLKPADNPLNHNGLMSNLSPHVDIRSSYMTCESNKHTHMHVT